MSNLIFKLETLNPNLRKTYFKHKNYTKYIAESKFAIKNKNTEHGLFGRIKNYDIQNEESVINVSSYIAKKAENKVPIFRGLISLQQEDAERLGYNKQEKWIELLENKLPSMAEQLKIKYEDLEYVGAVHWEEEHPHLQFMIWSKNKEKNSYFVKYKIKDNLRKEFINQVFREDLLEIYKEKDLTKREMIKNNETLSFLKNLPNENEINKYRIKDKELKNIVDKLIELKKDLKKIKGSIKYQYLEKYPDIINKVDEISRLIIESSLECQKYKEMYIDSKLKILKIKYTNISKIEEQSKLEKIKIEKEVIKLIGNKVLEIERKWLNEKLSYNNIKYKNEVSNLLDNILTFFCYQAKTKNQEYRNIEYKYKKNLSKQAKKELDKKLKHQSEFKWE